MKQAFTSIDFMTAYIGKGVNVILYPIKRNKFLFVFSWLMSITISIIANLNGIDNSIFSTCLLSIFDCYLFCLCAFLLSFLKLRWLSILIISLLLYSESFVVFFNHSLFNRYTIQLILETDTREGPQFIQSVLLSSESVITFSIFFFIIFLSLLITRASKKSFPYKSLWAFVFLPFLVWSGIRQYDSYKKVSNCFQAKYSIECEEEENMPELTTPLNRILYGIAYNSVLSGAELKTLNISVENSVIDSCSFKCPLIVVVIGESYSKHHSYLYNKSEVMNTPRLQERVDSKNLILYNNVISPFNHTHIVFRHMFSTWDDTCNDYWFNHTLFSAVFKKAGYNVFFITNQFISKSTDKYNILAGTLFNHYRLSELQFTSRNDHEHQYDLELLGDIPSMDLLISKPTLLLVHLLGQHVPYSERYPKDFEHFKPEQVHTKYGGPKERKIAADYMNATYYNDFVVDSLFSMFNKLDMVALYFSDHGEELFDWRNKYMRTDEEKILPEIARYQYEVPFMFYMTDTFKDKHKDIAEEIKSSSTKPFTLTDLPNLLFHLGGIRIKDYHEDKDLLSPHYNCSRKRLIHKGVDYDQLIKVKN